MRTPNASRTAVGVPSLRSRLAIWLALVWGGLPALAEDPADAAASKGAEEAPAATESSESAPQTFRLFSRRDVALRLSPNSGMRLPLLRPVYSPTTTDFEGRERKPGHRFSLAASFTLFDVDGERESAKAQEFRDLNEAVGVGLDTQLRTANAWLRLTGRHLGLDDQDLLFQLRRIGVLSADVLYSEIPHRYAFDSPSLYSGIDSGTLTIDDGIQGFLQESTSPVDAAERLRGVVASSASAVDLGHSRERTALDLDVTAWDPLAIQLQVKDESRQGSRPWSGSFGLANVVEIPWPVDYESEDATVSLEWKKGKTLVRGSYRHSDFEEGFDTVRFDNPWRLTDSSLGESIVSSFAGGPAAGLIDLYPSNSQDEQTLSFVRSQLPGDSTLLATVSWSELEQDDPLVAYTTNSAILPGAPGGPPFDAADPANRPATSANAKLDTRLVHLRWVSEPAEFLEIRAQFRDWQLDNETQQIFTPGLVLEDTLWRPFFGEAGGAFTNRPITFGRTSYGLKLSFDLPARSRLALSYDQEEVEREFREVDETDEDRFEITFDTKAGPWLDLRASYLHHERSISDYDFDQFYRNQGIDFIPALPFLVKFDQAPRDRDRFQLIASFYPTASLVVGASAIYGRDDYSESPFGLVEDDHEVYAVDLSYAVSERASFFGSYSFERYDVGLRGREWLPFGPGDPFNLETGLDSDSNWSVASRDEVDTVTLGLDVYLVKERLHFDLAFSFSQTDGRQRFASPVGEFDANPFVPADFDDVDDVIFSNLNPRLEYVINERAAVAVGYVRERYDLDDFNGQGFELVPVTPEGAFNGALFMGTFPLDYDLDVFYVQVRLGR